MEPSVFKAVEITIFEAVCRRYGSVSWTDLQVARARICKSYSDGGLRTKDATLLPFELEVLRLAYIHLHCPIHVHMVKDFLGRFWQVTKEFRIWHSQLYGQLQVCCVGGGPGSDLLGLSLFFRNHQITVNRIQGDVLDIWTQWEDTFRTLATNLDNQRFLTSVGWMDVRYWDFDFHQLWTNHLGQNMTRIRDANLVTMVKFVSAVASDEVSCEKKLTILLRFMQEGALLFILDNAGGGYAAIVYRAATAAGLQKIGGFEHIDVSLPQHEMTFISISQLRLVKINPDKTWKVSASLWRKGRGCINQKRLAKLSRPTIPNVSNIPISNVNLPSAQPQQAKYSPQITNSNLHVHQHSPPQPAPHNIAKSISSEPQSAPGATNLTYELNINQEHRTKQNFTPTHRDLNQIKTSQPSTIRSIPECHIPQPHTHQPRSRPLYPAPSTPHQNHSPTTTAAGKHHSRTPPVQQTVTSQSHSPVAEETDCCSACLRCCFFPCL